MNTVRSRSEVAHSPILAARKLLPRGTYWMSYWNVTLGRRFRSLLILITAYLKANSAELPLSSSVNKAPAKRKNEEFRITFAIQWRICSVASPRRLRRPLTATWFQMTSSHTINPSFSPFFLYGLPYTRSNRDLSLQRAKQYSQNYLRRVAYACETSAPTRPGLL